MFGRKIASACVMSRGKKSKSYRAVALALGECQRVVISGTSTAILKVAVLGYVRYEKKGAPLGSGVHDQTPSLATGVSPSERFFT